MLLLGETEAQLVYAAVVNTGVCGDKENWMHNSLYSIHIFSIIMTEKAARRLSLRLIFTSESE